jgi:hypothetical protein
MGVANARAAGAGGSLPMRAAMLQTTAASGAPQAMPLSVAQQQVTPLYCMYTD